MVASADMPASHVPSADASGPARALRIAYVIPAYPPAPSQPFVVNEMVEVQNAGHAVLIVPLYAGNDGGVRHGTFARLRPEAVLPPAMFSVPVLGGALLTAVRHPVRTLRALAAAFAGAWRNPFAVARLAAVVPKALAAARLLARYDVDRIHAHFASQTADCAAIASAVSGIPYSFTAHAYDIYSTDPRVRNDTLRWKLRQARQAFTVNEYAAELLRAQLPAAARQRVQTAYVGIPMDLFDVRPPAERGTRLRLLCVARLCEKKGLDTLVDACGVLRDRGVAFELRVFGEGPLRDALTAQVARLHLEGHVVLGGSIAQEDVAREMVACHAFVMPCRRDRSGDMDGIPTVFMEAMATGRPVISCAVSGVPELVRDGDTGILVPSDDAPALADAIARLAADDALRVRLGGAARALVERQHDQRRTAARFLALMTGAAAAESS
jgi:glycosyltransferase involved in cell wall biosynthesis